MDELEHVFTLLRPKYYISLNGCRTKFNIFYFILYLFYVIDDSLFYFMMLIESGILLKNEISCITVSFRQFTKTLDHVFFTYLVQTNI